MTTEIGFIENTEEQIKYLSSLRIMVGTPCYGGMVHESYMRGIMRLSSFAGVYQIPVGLTTIGNESLITRARNEIVKHFLLSDCTHLFFIDADIGFSEREVIQLLLHRQDVIVGAYPMKGIFWEGIKQNPGVPANQSTVKYAVNIKFDSDQSRAMNRVLLQDGLIELMDGSTGFMCISRNAIEKMVEAYPETYYYKEPPWIDVQDDGSRWALFDTMIDEDDRYLSEDYAFCRRWQKLGGRIWMEPTVVLNHTGTYTFQGYSVAENN